MHQVKDRLNNFVCYDLSAVEKMGMDYAYLAQLFTRRDCRSRLRKGVAYLEESRVQRAFIVYLLGIMQRQLHSTGVQWLSSFLSPTDSTLIHPRHFRSRATLVRVHYHAIRGSSPQCCPAFRHGKTESLSTGACHREA